MKTEDNTIRDPFAYRIKDHLLFAQNNESNFIQSNDDLDYQRSYNIRFLSKDKHFQEELDPQVCQDEKSQYNEVIENKKSQRITQNQENSGSISNEFYKKNQKWLIYLQNKQLQEQQVDMKERVEEIEKRIKEYDFEHRMLKCYYWLKYLIPLILILVPLFLFINRKH